MKETKKVFTSTEVQRNTGDFINSAFTLGSVVIQNRDRGTLFVLTKSELENKIKEGVEEGLKQGIKIGAEEGVKRGMLLKSKQD